MKKIVFLHLRIFNNSKMQKVFKDNYIQRDIQHAATRYRTIFIFFTLFFVLYASSYGQGNSEIKRDTAKGFDFFVNPSMYFGHKKNANYYRGVPSVMESGSADPNIRYILDNKYLHLQIMNLIKDHHRGIADTTFRLEELSNMRYTANFCFGIGARYRFTENLSIGVVFTQARMTAHGIANLGIKIMEVNSADVLPYPLVGKERRNFFELTAHYIFSTQGIVSPFLEAGMHVGNTRVISSELIVEERSFSLIDRSGVGTNYDPSLSYPERNLKLGGIGYGFSAAVGLRISFNKWAAIEPVAQFRLEKIQLAGYNSITPNYNFMIRLVLGDKVFAKTVN